MNSRTSQHRRKLTLWLSLLAALVAANPATAYPGGPELTIDTANDETQIVVKWVEPIDYFRPSPCNQHTYSMEVSNDGTLVAAYTNEQLQRDPATGRCFLLKTISSGVGYTNKISPGLWRARVDYRELGATNPGSIEQYKSVSACTASQGKQPMYRARNEALTDHFYSISFGTISAALGVGYTYGGVPFWMPNRAQYGSKPFNRFFKGAPQYEHFYTSDAWEAQFVQANGYVYEGDEGYLFEAYKPGTVALHRFNRFNAMNNDLQHYYTTDRYDANAAGWSYDTVAGYVCP